MEDTSAIADAAITGAVETIIKCSDESLIEEILKFRPNYPRNQISFAVLDPLREDMIVEKFVDYPADIFVQIIERLPDHIQNYERLGYVPGVGRLKKVLMKLDRIKEIASSNLTTIKQGYSDFGQSPEEAAALLLDKYIVNQQHRQQWSADGLLKEIAHQRIAGQPPHIQLALVDQLIARLEDYYLQYQEQQNNTDRYKFGDFVEFGLKDLLGEILSKKPRLSNEQIERIFEWSGRFHSMLITDQAFFPQLERLAESFVEMHPLPPYLLAMFRRSDVVFSIGSFKLKEILEANPLPVLNLGEAWSDKALGDLKGFAQPLRGHWVDLIQHAFGTTTAKPNSSWNKGARDLLKKVGEEAYVETVLNWLELVGKPRTFPLRPAIFSNTDPNQIFDEFNANALRGLIWCFALVDPSDSSTRLMGRLTEIALKKVKGLGPRAPKIANAAVYVLGQMNTPAALAQLARLKTRVTFKTTLKEIEKALDAAAAKAGVSKADLEEMGIPTFGLEEGGIRREVLGETNAELRVVGNDTSLNWFDAKGKALKNPPAAVKKDFAEELKELKAAQKDISGMITALSARLDGLFLAQKSWPLSVWQERYLNHPLMGTLARRLIWNIGGTPVGFSPSGGLEGPQGQQYKFAEDALVTLWHPIEATVDQIVAWREWLERHQIVQPFKQAHREVYILTDAERRTQVYSNRYAAHILKQHQFNALCGLRGWNNKLRLMVDDSYPPATLELPQWNLRAEFWVEGAGSEYGTDTNESGTYLYLATDQVRFYATGAWQNYAHAGGGGYEMWLQGGANPATPIPLEQIPPLVFSEVMRDVDLFVGVCSVGNDPTWNDGGPQGRYREYWQGYSFGELNATAETRKELLSRLIPRLKIAERSSLEGRFLRVRGELRTYKIHLGSGNILMEPNDQYLCIVPSQSGESIGNKVFLPFEGDRTLSIILSKAFLLAEDTKISDPTITRQIKG